MSREGELMRAALRKRLVPALVSMGFTGKSSCFQRRMGALDLIDIQYWKYGGEFILEFARAGRGDLKTSWGELVPEEKITVAHTSPLDRARLEQRGAMSGEHLRGFSFASFGEDREKYESLASEVASLLPQVEQWFETGRVGTHVRSQKAV
jgi:hypothetical protein